MTTKGNTRVKDFLEVCQVVCRVVISLRSLSEGKAIDIDLVLMCQLCLLPRAGEGRELIHTDRGSPRRFKEYIHDLK